MMKCITNQIQRLRECNLGFEYSFKQDHSFNDDNGGGDNGGTNSGGTNSGGTNSGGENCGVLFELLFVPGDHNFFDTFLGKEFIENKVNDTSDIDSELVGGKAHAIFIYPPDYPFRPPSISFINVPHFVKHPNLKNGAIEFCSEWCPAMDIKQQILTLYVILAEILKDPDYEDLVQIGDIIQPTIPLVND